MHLFMILLIIFVILAMTFSIATLLLQNKVLSGVSPKYRPVLLSTSGLVVSLLFLLVFSLILDRDNFPSVIMGDINSILIGIVVALFLLVITGFSYYFVNKPRINISIIFEGAIRRTVFNINYSVVEEIAFRGILFHSFIVYNYSTLGIYLNSILFGLMHLLNKLYGQKVEISAVIGTTAAGLLLSVLYFKWGLSAAIICHLLWNIFSGSLIKVFGLNQINGTLDFESAATTTLSLIVVSVGLYFLF